MLTYVHVNILLYRYKAFHNNNKHVNLKVYIGRYEPCRGLFFNTV